MPRRTWRRQRDDTLSAPAVPIHPEVAAKLRKLRNEKAALTSQLRDTARERDQLTDQLRAGRLMLDAALKKCEQDCAHGREVAGLRVQLRAMQAVQDEYRAREEARDSPRFLTRVEIPAQRRPS